MTIDRLQFFHYDRKCSASIHPAIQWQVSGAGIVTASKNGDVFTFVWNVFASGKAIKGILSALFLLSIEFLAERLAEDSMKNMI